MRIDPSPGRTVLNDAEYSPDAAFSTLPELNLMRRISTSSHRYTSYEVTAFKLLSPQESIKRRGGISEVLFSLRLKHLLCGDRLTYFEPSSNTPLTGPLSAGFVHRLHGPLQRLSTAHILRGELSLGHSNNNNRRGINLPI